MNISICWNFVWSKHEKEHLQFVQCLKEKQKSNKRAFASSSGLTEKCKKKVKHEKEHLKFCETQWRNDSRMQFRMQFLTFRGRSSR